MADTRRALADILTLFADNTAGDISAQDLRDFVVSVFGADSLFTGATKTASFTAAVGQIYPVDLSVATANFVVTFPSSPAAGDTFGFYVAVQSTTAGGSAFAQSPYWGVEPATSSNINDAAYTQSATDGVNRWGIMLAGELLIFRWDAVTSTWIVVRDGRTQISVGVILSANQTTNTANTWLDMNLDTLVTSDRFKVHNSAGGNVQIKRANDYSTSVKGAPASPVADQNSYIVAFGTTSVTPTAFLGLRQSSLSSLMAVAFQYVHTFTASQSVFGMFKAQESNRGALATASDGVATYVSLMEVL